MKEYQEIKVYCDGGSRGNPGPSAAGVVFLTPDDKIIDKFCKFLGHGTNNQAEYSAVELALEKLDEYKYEKVSFYLDSELIIRQLHGHYRVKDPILRQIFMKIKAKIDGKNITFEHVRRHFNKLADDQVNVCLDQHK